MIIRGVTRNIQGLTEIMTWMSQGNYDVNLMALERKDELGQMARAVEVFKHNGLEMIHLQNEHRQIAAEVEAERIRLLAELADNFEASVTVELNKATSVGADVGTQAVSMDSQVSIASESASAVNRGSEEINAGVQTVAAATEELAASPMNVAQLSIKERLFSKRVPRA